MKDGDDTDGVAVIDTDVFDSAGAKAADGGLARLSDDELLSMINGYSHLHRVCLGELRRRCDARGVAAPPALLN